MISVVLFDALHTLVTPRLPIATQYALTFEPYLGKFTPGVVQKSFKAALKKVQAERPAYTGLPDNWWSEVIYRTAIGAGADPTRVEQALPQIVPTLLHRFSSKKGYKLFDDTIPTLQTLQGLKVKMALVSNTDLRMKFVLDDLKVTQFFQAMSFSEEEGIEKPDSMIFHRTLEKMGYEAPLQRVLHVGDSYREDYTGAIQAGLSAILLRREEVPIEEEYIDDVPPEHLISSLAELPNLITSLP